MGGGGGVLDLEGRSPLSMHSTLCGWMHRTELNGKPKSNELTRWPTELVQNFRLEGGVYIGARVLLGINLIWFGYIARLSQWEGGEYFTRSNYFYLPSRLEEGRGG
jgi:hypothetical protein